MRRPAMPAVSKVSCAPASGCAGEDAHQPKWLGLPASSGVDWATRRRMLKMAAALPAIMGASSVSAQTSALGVGLTSGDFWGRPRSVWLHNSVTGEEVREIYWANGEVQMAGYRKICWLMRDFRLQQRIERMKAQQTAGRKVQIPADWNFAVTIDVTLLDILYATNGWLDAFGVGRPIRLNCGYRHKVTNDVTEGAAKNSEHMKAAAADITILGVNAMSVGRFGTWLKAGGVGFYPGRNFTHVDSGGLRYWRG